VTRNNTFVGCGIRNNTGFPHCGSHDYNFISKLNGSSKSIGFPSDIGAHDINGGSPQFIKANTDCMANTCNFRVGASSILIDRGTVISSFSIDKDGISRPAGAVGYSV
jgi:hypothetical protein